jgi:hypothetical protein
MLDKFWQAHRLIETVSLFSELNTSRADLQDRVSALRQKAPALFDKHRHLLPNGKVLLAHLPSEVRQQAAHCVPEPSLASLTQAYLAATCIDPEEQTVEDRKFVEKCIDLFLSQIHQDAVEHSTPRKAYPQRCGTAAQQKEI